MKNIKSMLLASLLTITLIAQAAVPTITNGYYGDSYYINYGDSDYNNSKKERANIKVNFYDKDNKQIDSHFFNFKDKYNIPAQATNLSVVVNTIPNTTVLDHVLITPNTSYNINRANVGKKAFRLDARPA